MVANQYGTIRDKKVAEDFFGEDMLENNKKNTVTILTNTPCVFIGLAREFFVEIKEKFGRKKRAHMEFLKQYMPGLENFSSKTVLESLITHVEEKVVQYDHPVIKENEKGEYIYFIYDGTCTVTKTIKQDVSKKLKEPLV